METGHRSLRNTGCGCCLNRPWWRLPVRNCAGKCWGVGARLCVAMGKCWLRWWGNPPPHRQRRTRRNTRGARGNGSRADPDFSIAPLRCAATKEARIYIVRGSYRQPPNAGCPLLPSPDKTHYVPPSGNSRRHFLALLRLNATQPLKDSLALVCRRRCGSRSPAGTKRGQGLRDRARIGCRHACPAPAADAGRSARAKGYHTAWRQGSLRRLRDFLQRQQKATPLLARGVMPCSRC